jgi:hypothetical protein
VRNDSKWGLERGRATRKLSQRALTRSLGRKYEAAARKTRAHRKPCQALGHGDPTGDHPLGSTPPQGNQQESLLEVIFKIVLTPFSDD